MTKPTQWIAPFQVNTGAAATPATQTPQAFGLSNGAILYAWVEEGTSGVASEYGFDIIGKILDAEGHVVRDSYRLNTQSSSHHETDFDIAATNDGGFMLVYRELITYSTPGSLDDMELNWERYDSEGEAIAGDRLARFTDFTYPDDDLLSPRVSVDQADNSAWITWERIKGDYRVDEGALVNDAAVQVTRLDPDGVVVAPESTLILSERAGAVPHDSALLADGGLVSVAAIGSDLEIRGLDAASAELFAPYLLTYPGFPLSDPRIVGLANGGFAVVGVLDDPGVRGKDIFVKEFDASGAATSSVRRISYSSSDEILPSVTALPDGDYAVVWKSGSGIMARRVTPGVTETVPEMVASQLYIDTSGATPDVAVTADGRLIFTWRGAGIETAIWDPRDSTIHASDHDSPSRLFQATDVITAITGVDTTIIGDDDDDTMLGQDGDDSLLGGLGDDVLLGGEGDDTLDGGDGGGGHALSDNDTLRGGAGDDRLVYSENSTSAGSLDLFDGGADDDTFVLSNAGLGHRVADLAAGTFATMRGDLRGTLVDIENVEVNGAHTVIGDDGANVLTSVSASAGATFDGGGGADLLQGGGGDDILRGGAGEDRVSGGDGDDGIEGGEGADVLSGDGDDDHLQGGEGEDRMFGGADDDLLEGGDDDDLLVGDGVFDMVRLNAGAVRGDRLEASGVALPTGDMTLEFLLRADAPAEPGRYQAIASYATAAQSNELLLGLGADGDLELIVKGVAIQTNIDGTGLFGSGLHRVSISIAAASGLTLFIDGAQVWQGPVSGAPGTGGTLVFGQDQDTLGGGFDPDQAFVGQIGDIRVFAGAVDPGVIEAEAWAAPDDLSSVPAAHWVVNAATGEIDNVAPGGTDALAPVGAAEWIGQGGAGGSDELHGGRGEDAVYGGADADVLFGGDDDDRLFGGADADTLSGGTGVDRLEGGAGDDVLYGDADSRGNNSLVVLNRGSATGQYLEAPLIAGMPARDVTIEWLFRADGPADPGASPSFLSYAIPGGPDELGASTDASNNIVLAFSGEVFATGVSADRLFDGELHRMSLRVDQIDNYYTSNSTVDLLIDGVVAASHRFRLRDVESGGALVFGQRQEVPGGGFDPAREAVGAFGDIRVFGSALDDASIRTIAFDTELSRGASERVAAQWAVDPDTGTMVSVSPHSSPEMVIHGGPDIVDRRGAGDALFGGDGEDTLYGEFGADSLSGDDGDDLLLGGVGGDALDGGEGVDMASYLTAVTGVIADLMTPGENTGDAAGDTYASIENLYGSRYDDELRGDDGANTLHGYAGDDTLRGRGGDDTFYGHIGDDRIYGGAGFDELQLVGAFGNDTVTGVERLVRDGVVMDGSESGWAFEADGLRFTSGRNSLLLTDWSAPGDYGLDVPLMLDVGGAALPVTNYDPTQDFGTALVDAGGTAVTLRGNAWKYVRTDSVITANTVLSFDIRSADLGESTAIGFDANARFANSDLARFFEIGGDGSLSGAMAAQLGYVGDDQVRHYEINVGEHYTGAFANLVMLTDDDGDASGSATFSNLEIFERVPLRIADASALPESYDPAQDFGTARVSEDGTAVTLSGNAWKMFDIGATLTADTWLQITVDAADVGEILGIGFVNRPGLDHTRMLQLGGDETYYNTDLSVYKSADRVTDGHGPQQRFIRVGEIFGPGRADNMVLFVDDDEDGSGTATFSDIDLLEGMPLRVNGELATVSDYDPAQDYGRATSVKSATGITLSDNAWKSVAVDATITDRTVLAFDFATRYAGEIIGIGFDKDNRFSGTGEFRHFFRLGGSEQADLNPISPVYTGNGAMQHIEIAVGEVFQGDFANLVLVCDDDNGGFGKATFSNITLFERPPEEVLLGATSRAVESQGPATQDEGIAAASADHREVALSGNAWKAVEAGVDLTPDTILAFEFASDAPGEIAAIGFDDDAVVGGADLRHLYQLAGSDLLSVAAGQLGYDGAGAFQSFEIAVGADFAGTVDRLERLVMVMDDDRDGAGLPSGAGVFRDVEILREAFSANVVSHGGGVQDQGRALEFAEGGTLKLDQNAWKAILPGQSMAVDANTVLSFDFRADVEGEIQGIGFARNAALNDDFFFQLAGSQAWGLGAEDGVYTIDEGFRHFEIAVGEHFTGTFDRLVLGMDSDDLPGHRGDAYFGSIVLTGLGADDHTLLIL